DFNLKNFNKKILIETKDKKEIDKIFISENIVHQGVAAEIESIPTVELKEYLKSKSNSKNTLVVLDDITDQRNIGSIIRSCSAFNIDAVILLEKNYNPKNKMMYKSASGAMELVNIIPVSNITNALEVLKKNNYWVYGLDGNAKENIEDQKWSNQNVFVFGSEGDGLRRLVKENCDHLIKIQINKEIESLNVSNAVSTTLGIFRLLERKN
ncbi:MAG: 23S rRNA (guanosine(2251)-2'-O)-methyltransferase RlmB, partial [Candidatus Fonsibacter ubiquis]|nr:23S rRNA (guanosine(2251)-2'-O)-methyltransferase RlmB [Candidatus Fonsibacter ubiquis]